MRHAFHRDEDTLAVWPAPCRLLAICCLFPLLLACNPFAGEISETTELVSYESCDELEADLKEMVRGELEQRYRRASENASFLDVGVPFGAMAPMEAADGGMATRGEAAVPGSDPFGEDPELEGQDPHDFSETNNQEAGVDEADLVKTDGEHLYVVDGSSLHVFAVPEFGDLVPLSRTRVDGTPSQLLIRHDRAIVFSLVSAGDLPSGHPLRERLFDTNSWRCEWWSPEGERMSTNDIPKAAKLTVLDVSDREEPAVVREVYMEGGYQTARRIDDTILVGLFAKPHVAPLATPFSGSRRQIDRQRRERLSELADLTLEDLVPQIYEKTPDGRYEAHDLCGETCDGFLRPAHSSGRGISTVIGVDLFGDSVQLSAQHVIGNRPAFYASRDRIYIAESARDWWFYYFNEDHPDQTNIHAFDIVGTGETRYLGSGRVKGRVVNQFSLSEYDGHLRVATTEKLEMRWWESWNWEPEAENHIFVLSLEAEDGKLPMAGSVEGIEPGEQIFSARFVEEKGFIVTFPGQPQHGIDLLPPTRAEEACGDDATGFVSPRPFDVTIFFGIDPLFTIDLSDPTEPRVVGDLKISGFSTYIHPIEDDCLLTVGVAGDDDGSTWGFQVSLFDVSDFADPFLVDLEELIPEGVMGDSEAMVEHKAFTYWAPRGLLAVPVSSRERITEDGRDRWHNHSRLELINVDTSTGLSRHGVIDHSPLFDTELDDRWWVPRDVRRSFFMGDHIYTISDAGVMVHDIDELEQVEARRFSDL